MTFPPISSHVRVRVEALYIYPVKSCAGIEVGHIDFDRYGNIAGNRQWAVVNADDKVTWQGTYPRLALVRPKYHETGLLLEAPATAPLKLRTKGERCRIKLWSESLQRHETHDAQDAGPEARAWLSGVVGADVRLVRFGATAIEQDCANAVHIISRSSLDELNASLTERGMLPVEAERFRPNVVIAGQDEQLIPFLEEHMLALRWAGRAEMKTNCLCIRCVVPNVDPRSAQVGEETMTTAAELSAMRHPGKPVYFGIYASVAGGGRLSSGERGEAEINF